MLAYTRTHGSIVRAEAAELRSITPEQASPVLRGLVVDGRLAMTGSRRWARYVLPTDGGEAVGPMGPRVRWAGISRPDGLVSGLRQRGGGCPTAVPENSGINARVP